MNIKIILADDHAVVRDGIKAIINRMAKNIEVVAEASSGEELLELAQKSRADVYIVDIAMPTLSGIETIERLLKIQPDSRAIVLSMYGDRVLVERALKSGAMGYILKESATEEIIRAINEVFKGRYFLSPNISGYVVQGFINKESGGAAKGKVNVLTMRQREIIKLIGEGLTDKEIASKLNLSPNTVHVHKNNIMDKLDIHNKAGLIRYAIRKGILQV